MAKLEFSITPFTDQQIELLTIMWEIPTVKELQEWRSHQIPSVKQDIDLLEQILIWHCIDQDVEENDLSEAREVLERYTL